MIVRKTKPLPVECVVRRYLAGSGWKEYQASQSICGNLSPGLQLASKLPGLIFTPSTKNESGHDMNLSMEECRRILGDKIAETARENSLAVFQKGSDYADERGIIVADTKFEFGMIDGEMLLIDECLTPDSSRFWPKDEYIVGESPPSFDKQFVRDIWRRSHGTRLRRDHGCRRSHRKDVREIFGGIEQLTSRCKV